MDKIIEIDLKAKQLDETVEKNRISATKMTN
jgi:hypothetical protein